MKNKLALIFGILFGLATSAMAVIYLVLGIAESLANGLSETGEKGIIIYFTYLSAFVAILSIISSILSVKRPKPAGIMFIIELVLFLFSVIYTLVTLTAEFLFVAVAFVTIVFGALATVYCFVRRTDGE